MPTLPDEVRSEIRFEHQQVCDPLLRRIAQVGEEIQEGADYPVEYLREGLQLWKRYLTELRDQRAEQVVLPLLAEGHVAPNDPRVVALRSERPRETEQLATLERHIEGYKDRRPQARWRLGNDLRNDALANKAWRDEEERFVVECLPERVSEERARSIGEALGRLQAATHVLADAVRSYVTRPVAGVTPAPAHRPST